MPALSDIASRFPLSPLTERQHEIVMRLIDGKTIEEIALELHLSRSGVFYHTSQIKRKWNASSIADIIRLAILSGQFN